MSDLDDTMKIIKWARKRGACLIKVHGVELTFPIGHVKEDVFTKPLTDMAVENEKGAHSLRQALSTDALNQIEDQEQWFYNNRPPQI